MKCVLLTTSLAAASLLAHAQTFVPYIGCPGDGQTGPYEAAKGSPKLVNLPPAIADQLAWYEYNGDAGRFGALGPRGWNCFVTVGSNGWTLYIAPELLDSAKLLEHKNWKGFRGAAIQLSGSDGGTSGRFEVAKVVARVFPAHRDYARSIIAEGFGPASDYPFGPFPSDHLTYKGKDLVQFTTPAHLKGLGTMSWVLRSCRPTNPSPASSYSRSDLTSTQDFYICVSAFRPRFPCCLRFSSSKPKQMPQADPQKEDLRCVLRV